MAKIFNFHLGIEEQSTPTARTDTGYLYTKDFTSATELCYYDAAGQEVQITDNGSLNVTTSTPTKIENGTSKVEIASPNSSIVQTTAGVQRTDLDADGDLTANLRAYDVNATGYITLTSTYAPGGGAEDVVVIETTQSSADIKLQATGSGSATYVSGVGTANLTSAGTVYVTGDNQVAIESSVNDGSNGIVLQTTGATTGGAIKVDSSNAIDVDANAGITLTSSYAPGTPADTIIIETTQANADIVVKNSGNAGLYLTGGYGIYLECTAGGIQGTATSDISFESTLTGGVGITLNASGTNATMEISSNSDLDISTVAGDIGITAGTDGDINISALGDTTGNIDVHANENLTLDGQEAFYVKLNGTNYVYTSSTDLYMNTSTNAYVVSGAGTVVNATTNIMLNSSADTGTGGIFLSALGNTANQGGVINLTTLKADIILHSTATPDVAEDNIYIYTDSTNSNIKIKSTLANVTIESGVSTAVNATSSIFLNSSADNGTGGIYVSALGNTSGNGGIINLTTLKGEIILLSTATPDTSEDCILLQTTQSNADIRIETTGTANNGVIVDGKTKVELDLNGTTYIQLASSDVNITPTEDINLTAGTDGDVNIYALGDTTGVIDIHANAELYIDGQEALELRRSGTTIVEVETTGINVMGTGVSLFERSTALTTGLATSIHIVHKTSGNMADTFASGMVFSIEDSAAVTNNIAYISAERDGADNSGALKLVTYSSGSVGTSLYIDSTGKIATGGETAPDVTAGGITLYQGADDDFILTAKSSDIAHGMTNVAETDTYFYLSKNNATTGGITLAGLSENTIGIFIRSFQTNGESTTSTAAYGCITLSSNKKSGTGYGAVSSTDNMTAWRNYATTRMILKGSGQLYNDYSTAMTTYDDYNDLELARNTQLALSTEERTKLNKQTIQQLSDLGIINEHGFGSVQQINAVSLGAVTQLGNVVKLMAKELGWSDAKLLEALKTY